MKQSDLTLQAAGIRTFIPCPKFNLVKFGGGNKLSAQFKTKYSTKILGFGFERGENILMKAATKFYFKFWAVRYTINLYE